eukprot:CAMPEP_0176467504 /NCGR_PEP_ID=MMETSP0127-20121128/38499_1 /TAXON_ID=938130 /ORGANISM="Platyophrya macrostoma, Strain WH" /LENGTH=129 /DNA_ID=CAMNT_0017860819 /DNA_START=27 /DNA_END=412 /DNA_ORIENTATION=-
MGKFKASSSYKYYDYLKLYNSEFLRKYQSLNYFNSGRRSLWRNLVIRTAGDHINLEEEHNTKYKTHTSFYLFSYRFSVFLAFYMMVYTGMFLGEQGYIFNQKEFDYLVNPSPDNEYPTRYERFYVYDKV